jgi:hypothetical protein
MKRKPERPPSSLSRVTSIRVREDLWTRARIFAVKTNDTLQGVINRALEDLLKREETSKVYVTQQDTTKKPYKTVVYVREEARK